MTPTTHAVAAYAVTILLLWGYAAVLWRSARRQRTAHSQDKAGDEPGTARGQSRGEE